MKSYKNISCHNYLIWISLSVILFSSFSFSQRIVDKNKGNPNNTKHGFLDGNLVGTIYHNFGEIADWQNFAALSGVWPKGTNHTYVDGVAVIVQAEATAPGGQIIHPLETNYYEYTRADPISKNTYGWYSLPNYSSSDSHGPIARSDDPTTWPASWPDQNSDWNGQWNGFFGKNIKNADVETFFVFDDDQDRQYINEFNFRPDAADSSRGGLGMQVRARGFQWSQVLAEDVIFWYYEIINMGTTDYPKTLFGQYIDWGIGGHDNSSNNAGTYDKVLNISYAWSTVPFGTPGNWSPVGYCGYAFLESPGIPDDGIDNDLDGLTDEKRDNDATVFIERSEDDPFMKNLGIDTVNFRNFYGVSWQHHWDADENQNWRSYIDVNKNGKWDPGEPLQDDVGIDGLGPYDAGYPGPDPGEGDGKPEQGEPNFGILDKDESDQLGLTGFQIFATHKYDLNNDENNWNALSLNNLQGQTLSGVNLANLFSSSLFHMDGRTTYSIKTGLAQETGETQRFSMALIFGLNTDDLFRRKKTVQSIYNANYHFAQPPAKPIIKAIAGDHKVTLYWDSRAELTFDPFYQKVNFEGYRIYRSTEPNFIEDKTVTDAYGVPVFRMPVYQNGSYAIFDLVDGVKGLHPIDINGAKFNLGNDSGLRHSYVDSTVTNGQVYYYAVCSYDQGFVQTNIEGQTLGIPPSETTSIIKVDINGNYKTDVNTAVVNPHATGAGYIDPQISNLKKFGPATGGAGVTILDPDSMKSFNTYRVEFSNNSPYNNNPYPSYSIINYSTNDTLLKLTPFSGDKVQTLVTQGFSVNLKNDSSVAPDNLNPEWKSGSSNTKILVSDTAYSSSFQSKRIPHHYPADFEIRFTDPLQGDTSFPQGDFFTPIPSNIIVKNLTENIDHVQFVFFDLDNNNKFSAGDAICLVIGDSAGKRAADYADPGTHIIWAVQLFIKDTTNKDPDQLLPKPGDIIHFTTTKPFRSGDYVEFTSQKADFNRSKAILDLDKIAVVPNPYVGAASWEPATATTGRGERVIYFIHLPNKCTIRIYTISGNLVKTLEHDAPLTDGQQRWDLTTKDGMSLAFGVYIFHVDAPGIGQKIGKFAIIK
jgi:hypothetical protein